MFQYKEKHETANPLRSAYLDGLHKLVDRKREEADEKRTLRLQKILDCPDAFREEFYEMLGWPLTEPKSTEPPQMISKTFLFKEEDIAAYRMQFKILDCVPFYGILFVKEDGVKRPFVLASHGGDGTPEVCSGIFEDGSFNYNDMAHRIVKCGANVFAPQLMLWDTQKFPVFDEGKEPKALRPELERDLKQVGSSIAAVEIYALRRVLDYFCAQPFVDEQKIGMIGLSYGGFYTLFTTAAEPRIKAALSSCFYNNRYVYNWHDWFWSDSANKFLDNEVLALVSPRKICIQVGDADPLFDVKLAKAEMEKFCKAAGEKSNYVTFMPFRGVHEFSTDDTPILELIEELNR